MYIFLMCTLKGKPFPATIYEESTMRARHYCIFWSLYNDLCLDDVYWSYYVRQDLAKLLKTYNPLFQVGHLTSILETLARHGYVEFRTLEDRAIGTGVQAYEIRIHPQAWSKPAPNKRSAEMQKIYRLKRSAKLAQTAAEHLESDL